MKNKLSRFLSVATLSSMALLTGCATYPDGTIHSKCSNGTNYGAAAVGALGGAAAGSLIGAGTGNALAIGAGAVAGGVVGSKTNIGC